MDVSACSLSFACMQMQLFCRSAPRHLCAWQIRPSGVSQGGRAGFSREVIEIVRDCRVAGLPLGLTLRHGDHPVRAHPGARREPRLRAPPDQAAHQLHSHPGYAVSTHCIMQSSPGQSGQLYRCKECADHMRLPLARQTHHMQLQLPCWPCSVRTRWAVVRRHAATAVYHALGSSDM